MTSRFVALNPDFSVSGSVTQTQFLPNRALFTLHNATPVETAETVFLQNHSFLPVTPLATQQVTSAYVQSRAVAHSAPGAQRPRLSVGQAEVRRLGQIDQVLLVRRFDVLAHGDDSFTVVPTHHFRGSVEALEQAVAHLTEVRHFFPAGP